MWLSLLLVKVSVLALTFTAAFASIVGVMSLCLFWNVKVDLVLLVAVFLCVFFHTLFRFRGMYD